MICALCGNKFEDYPATSRVDGKTEICPNCRVQEALIHQDYQTFKALWAGAIRQPDWTKLEKRFNQQSKKSVGRD